MFWVRTGGVVMAAAIVLGAFGAHFLKSRLDAYATDVYAKAVLYHLVHGLALFVVAWLVHENPKANLAGNLFLAGILLFSGSLYLLSVTGVRALGAVTPLGGACFIAGWLVLAFSVKS